MLDSNVNPRRIIFEQKRSVFIAGYFYSERIARGRGGCQCFSSMFIPVYQLSDGTECRDGMFFGSNRHSAASLAGFASVYLLRLSFW